MMAGHHGSRCSWIARARAACLEGFYETPDAFYLVMEFVEGGELFDKLVADGAQSEGRASEVTRQVADAVAFLHAQGLCHADIKPENLLLTSHGPDAAVKLVDFGLTTQIRDSAGAGREAHAGREAISGGAPKKPEEDKEWSWRPRLWRYGKN